ncbi:MAG: hypothetical protein ACRDP1_03975 [Nocardioidaceae bacterium]
MHLFRSPTKLSTRLVLPLSALGLLLAGLTTASTANANTASASTASGCHNGTLASGTYNHGLRITGACAVPAGANVTVNGNLVVSGKHAMLIALAPANITINGNAFARNGAVLGLGVPNEGQGCPSTASAIVNGNVIARHALTMFLDCTTIHGNVTSWRGGMGGFSSDCEATNPHALNFVIKDNVIFGTTSVHHWRGCWMGYIRNVEYGNVQLLGNHPADADAMEIVTNTIFGNLGCWRNSPHPQVGDSGGGPNQVLGREMGQCRGL